MRKLFSRQLVEARHEMLSIYEAIDLVKCCEGRTSYGGPSEASVNNQIRLAMDQLAAWEANNA